MHVRAEAAVKFQKTLHQKRGQQKRYGQPERIYPQEESAFEQRAFLRSYSENSRQNWAQARSPAESKGEANHKRTEGSIAAFHIMQASIRIKRIDLEDAGQVQSEENDDDARDSCH